jgi:hypothetical protein
MFVAHMLISYSTDAARLTRQERAVVSGVVKEQVCTSTNGGDGGGGGALSGHAIAAATWSDSVRLRKALGVPATRFRTLLLAPALTASVICACDRHAWRAESSATAPAT